MATKGFAFGNHKLLKKLDQNFYFCSSQARCREVETQTTHPANTWNWVQAQPAANWARHHAAVNWAWAQPAERSRRQAICARTLTLDLQKLRSRIGCRLSLLDIDAASWCILGAGQEKSLLHLTGGRRKETE